MDDNEVCRISSNGGSPPAGAELQVETQPPPRGNAQGSGPLAGRSNGVRMFVPQRVDGQKPKEF